MSYGITTIKVNRDVIAGEPITPDDIEQPLETCGICGLDIYPLQEPLPCYGVVVVDRMEKHICRRCIYELNDYLCIQMRYLHNPNRAMFFPSDLLKGDKA